MAGMAGLNIGALPMNPALVAAALNQAGWGILGANLGAGGGGPGGGPAGQGVEPHGGFPTPTSFSTHGNVTTTPVCVIAVSCNNMNQHFIEFQNHQTNFIMNFISFTGWSRSYNYDECRSR